MAKIIVIGGIESTYRNAQVLHDLGEEILLFVTRGKTSKGWEGVRLIDEEEFPFSKSVPKLVVENNINDHTNFLRDLRADFIWSLGWQQIFSDALLNASKFIGLHESLLPEGAGAVPIANAILHDQNVTGVTLFWLEPGVDTGPIIGQLRGTLNPREVTSTDLYKEAMELEKKLIQQWVPLLNSGNAPRIPQDFSRRTVFRKINWSDWPDEKVKRARTYPYL